MVLNGAPQVGEENIMHSAKPVIFSHRRSCHRDNLNRIFSVGADDWRAQKRAAVPSS
jgi:hypothetical protein